MQKVFFYIKPFDLSKVIKELENIGIIELYVEEVKYFNSSDKINFLPRFKIEFSVENMIQQNLDVIKTFFSRVVFDYIDKEDYILIKTIIEIIDILTGEKNIIMNNLLNNQTNH